MYKAMKSGQLCLLYLLDIDRELECLRFIVIALTRNTH